jgi:hypothetical protein
MKRERVVLMGDRRLGGRIFGWDARNPHKPTYHVRKEKKR